jgi:hypothetical protein
MPRATQLQSLTDNLTRIFDTLSIATQISRAKRLQLNHILCSHELLHSLASPLYGPAREVISPGEAEAKLVLLSVREPDRRQSALLVFQRVTAPRRTRPPFRCLRGHRFTEPLMQPFRLNLRQLFELFDVAEEYSGFDGAAVNIIADLRQRISRCDFCLCDNRETTVPSKPNVDIEAGMAFALQRPFILCHYKRAVWPADFSTFSYVSYPSSKDLFQKLSALWPLFLTEKISAGGT